VDIPLFGTLGDVQTWVKKVVPQQGDQRKPDVLDALVLWTRAVMRELDASSQYENEFTVSVPLNQPFGKKNATILTVAEIATAFTSANATGQLTFELKSDALPVAAVPTNVRVVGIGLTVEFTLDDASAVQYAQSFPQAVGGQPGFVEKFENRKMARLNATVTTPAQTLQGGGTYLRPQLFLANVRIQGGTGGDLEPLLSYDPACRGLNPFGWWTIFVDPNAVEFFATSTSSPPLPNKEIQGVILHLRLRGKLG
jgi:hypothetical protein